MKTQRILPILIAVVSFLCSGCDLMTNLVQSKSVADQAVTEFRNRFEKSHYTLIYEAAHEDLKSSVSEEDFVAQLDAFHKKLGKAENCFLTGCKVETVNSATNVHLTYTLSYPAGNAAEHFNYLIEGNRAYLQGYGITSQLVALH